MVFDWYFNELEATQLACLWMIEHFRREEGEGGEAT